MFVIPSIDLRHGKVVRLRQGDYADQLNYDVDPLATAGAFAAAGAKHVHIVDLDGAKEGRPVQIDLIRKVIQSTKAQVQVGGGIRSDADVAAMLDAGAARVVIGTRAVQDLPWLAQLLESPKFTGKIVLALDARDGIVATHGWLSSSGQQAVDIAKLANHWPLAGILYTDVAKDGMMSGPNYPQTSKLVEATHLPIIASGGVGNLQHIEQVKATGCWGVIVGRSLYEGTVNLAEAIGAAERA